MFWPTINIHTRLGTISSKLERVGAAGFRACSWVWGGISASLLCITQVRALADGWASEACKVARPGRSGSPFTLCSYLRWYWLYGGCNGRGSEDIRYHMYLMFASCYVKDSVTITYNKPSAVSKALVTHSKKKKKGWEPIKTTNATKIRIAQKAPLLEPSTLLRLRLENYCYPQCSESVDS